MALRHFGARHFNANHFNPTHLGGISTGGGVVARIPLPSVGGFGAPGKKQREDILDDIDYDDERVLMMVIKKFLEGQR